MFFFPFLLFPLLSSCLTLSVVLSLYQSMYRIVDVSLLVIYHSNNWHLKVNRMRMHLKSNICARSGARHI
uniref:Putative secreted protein n=1 Tax=Anopheles darlingi TaxID=43151 RepID=A0A2M4D7J3_ANODA